MPRKTLTILAVLLPILLPLFFVGQTLYMRHDAAIYKIKIEGYDPRDMLYGHYLTFRFVEDHLKKQPISNEAKTKIRRLDRRYYIPEAEAQTLEKLLRGNNHDMRVGVGITPDERVYIQKLYIDDKSMEDFLATYTSH